MMKLFSKVVFFLALFIIVFHLFQCQAQTIKRDTVQLSIQAAEKRFMDSNFLLLAAHYNVDAQKALIEQAKLWQNPTINTDQVIAADGKFFPYKKPKGASVGGQYYIQVQQLIQTAGKRGKLIKLATTNTQLSELQLKELMRNLRYQLRQDFFNLSQQFELLHIYDGQAAQLNKLISGMEAQLLAGNVAQKDVLRLKALRIALEQDVTDLKRNIEDNENDLKTLLQIKNDAVIQPLPATANVIELKSSAEEMVNKALQNNPNYLLQQQTTEYQQQNLAYQKALRTPDITLGPNYDHNSNFAPNYFGLGVSLPLPLWNKNQGNIKNAQFTIQQQQSVVQNAATELVNNVTTAYHKLNLLLNQQQQHTSNNFYSDYQKIYNNMLQSYRDRKISLLEFLDFFDDYTDVQKRQLQQMLNIQLGNEELNFYIGY